MIQRIPITKEIFTLRSVLAERIVSFNEMPAANFERLWRQFAARLDTAAPEDPIMDYLPEIVAHFEAIKGATAQARVTEDNAHRLVRLQLLLGAAPGPKEYREQARKQFALLAVLSFLGLGRREVFETKAADLQGGKRVLPAGINFFYVPTALAVSAGVPEYPLLVVRSSQEDEKGDLESEDGQPDSSEDGDEKADDHELAIQTGGGPKEEKRSGVKSCVVCKQPLALDRVLCGKCDEEVHKACGAKNPEDGTTLCLACGLCDEFFSDLPPLPGADPANPNVMLSFKDTSIGPFTIEKNVLREIQNSNKLTGVIIDAMLELMKGKTNEVVVVPPIYTRAFLEDKESRAVETFRSECPVVTVINVGDHWVTIFIRKDRIGVLNSIHGYDPHGIVDNFVTRLERLRGSKLRVCHHACPQQKNAVDCGVFAVAFSLCETLNLRWLFTAAHIPKLRYWIQRCLRHRTLFAPPFRMKLYSAVERNRKVVVIADFRRPSVPPQTEGSMQCGTVLTWSKLESKAIEGMKPQSRARHLRMLNLLQNYVSKNRVDLTESLPLVVVKFTHHMKRLLKWKPSTTRTNYGATLSALKRGDQYGATAIDLSTTSCRDLTKQLRVACQKQAKVLKPAISVIQASEVWRQLKNHGQTLEAAVFALAWAHAARAINVLCLEKWMVSFHEKALTTVVWADAKTSAVRGAYVTICPMVMDAWNQTSEMFKALSERSSKIVPQSDQGKVLTEIRNAMRKVTGSSSMDLRAIRRGSLRTMASAGIPLEQLMKVSGHTNTKTLMIYLDWGLWAAEHLQATANAARSTIWEDRTC